MVAAIEANVALHGSSRLAVTSAQSDEAWDGFLSRGNHSHVQSSLWGRLKAGFGWQVRRIRVETDGRIVGGVQLLLRPVPVFGRIGYVSRGPVLDSDEPGLFKALLGELLRTAANEGVRYLIVQPESSGANEGEQLLECGFQPSVMSVGPTATVLLDLGRDVEALSAAMRTNTRRNIRLADRNGIVVREGTRADLLTFYRLLSRTAERQHFDPEPLAYYEAMGDLFGPGGHLRLFFSEHEGRPIGGLLALAFGETVVYKRAGWSGELGKLHPNETLMWTAIRWAKAAGFRYYDFEGITRDVADATLAGSPSLQENSDTYKLNFGGDVVTLGGAYECFPAGLLAGVSRRIAPVIQRRQMFHRFAKSLRVS